MSPGCLMAFTLQAYSRGITCPQAIRVVRTERTKYLSRRKTSAKSIREDASPAKCSPRIWKQITEFLVININTYTDRSVATQENTYKYNSIHRFDGGCLTC